MKITLLALSFSFLLFPFHHAHAADEQSGEKQILVISSYFPLRENGNQIIASFKKEISQRYPSRIAVEYMDCESLPAFGDWTKWMGQLFSAYHQKPEAVVILGSEAWAAYRVSCIGAWEDIPVILGCVKYRQIDYEHSIPKDSVELKDISLTVESFDDFKVTGYYITDFFEENLQLIHRLQPEIAHIGFIYDNRFMINFFQGYLEKIIKKEGFTDMQYLTGDKFTTPQLVDSIFAMDKTHALLQAGWYTDANRYPHAYSMLNNELDNDPDKFMYLLQDQGFMNRNELGGYFVSGQEIGRDVADLTYQVLTKGIAGSPEFQETPANPGYHINYPTLVDAGISPSRLPSGTILHNRPLSLLDEYLWEAILIGAIFLSVVAILVLILLYRKNREKFYRKANLQMKKLIEAMPDMAIIYDQHLTVVDIINSREDCPELIKSGRCIGMNISAIRKELPQMKEAWDTIERNVTDTARTGKINSFSFHSPSDRGIRYSDARSVPYETGSVICFMHDVTPNMEAQKKIEQLQAFLQSIVDNLPVGLHVKDASDDFRYLLYNEKVYEFHENATGALLGKNDFELNNPYAEQYRQDDLATLGSNVPMTFDRIYHDEAGQLIRCGIATKRTLTNNDGSRYIITVLIDLTETRKKEIEYENARRHLSIAMDAGSLSAWKYDVRQQRYESIHNETVSSTGLSMEESFRTLHPDDHAKYKTMISRLSSGEAERMKEVLRFNRTGKYEWYETYAIGLKDPKTGLIGQIIGTEKNITQAVLDEQKLKEYIFKFGMVSNSDGLLQWDYDVASQTFTSPNPESFFYHGFSLQQFLALIHPEDRPMITQSIADLSSGQAESLTTQARVVYPDKGYRWMEMHGVIYARNPDGTVATVSGLRRDITEMKRITEELIVLRDKAEESNRLKSAFLANMSHEIRTPLNAIVGFSNLIAETDDREQAAEFCKIVRTNNELLLQLINDILDLSKIEAGQLEFIYSDFDVCGLFYELLQVYQGKTGPDVELLCELPEKSRFIRSERNRLTQVLSNFLNNALKFTSEGSIRIGYTVEGDSLRFYVTDTGTGIAEENQERVFNRFVKLDSFVQGTGLGLSICEVIIKHLNGQIGVDSQEGKGSTFWFTIPLTPPEHPAPAYGNKAHTAQEDQKAKEAAVTATPETGALQQEPAQKLILVAEDNDSNYLLLSSALKHDYCLMWARNGKEAVEMHRELKPDLILMDIKMPVMTGLEATAEIRRRDKKVPIVALTAYAFESDREEALDAGCNEVMTKPVHIRKLRGLLNVLFDQ